MPLRGGYLDKFSKAWGNLSIRWGPRPRGSAPPLIAWMSLQLAIPWQVGLHQSLPPLCNQVQYPAILSCRSMDFHRLADSRILARNAYNFR